MTMRREAMATTRIRRVADQREAERTRDDMITTGYKVKAEGENSVLMSNAGWGSVGGHIVVALLTVWWTLGLGNLVYALIAHYTQGDSVLIKIDESIAPAVAP